MSSSPVRGPRWRVLAVVTALAVVGVLFAPGPASTDAAFKDQEVALGGALTAGNVARPTGASCTVQTLNILLVDVFQSVTVTWTSPYPLADQILIVGNGTQSGQVAGANITQTGTTFKAVLTTGILQTLLSNLLGGTSTLTLTHRLPGTNWTSTPLSYTLRIGGLLGLTGPNTCTPNP